MHHYLVIHTINRYPESQDEWLSLWESVLDNVCGDSTWMYSYYDPADEKLYCLWHAESEDQIRACFSDEGIEMAPVKEIREVAFFNIQELAKNQE